MMSLRIVLLALSVTLAAGCAKRTTSAHSSLPTATALEPIELSVENHNWLDVVVFVVHGGQRTRLVTVTAAKNASALIPEHALQHHGQIRLLAHAVGNPETFMSEVIVARRGMRIEWTLESDLKRSSVAVW
jgi:type IV pilus biogenesis protein CpaD/CtpE